jgi:predicted DsbA family dithiol-disulfide isomerase
MAIATNSNARTESNRHPRASTPIAEATPAVTITHYADPFSPWSAGFSPVLSQLQSIYGNQLHIDYKMGGMARNVDQWIDQQGLDNDSIVSWIADVANHTNTAIDFDFIAKTGVKTTWVGALAFTAAAKRDAASAIRFLNRMIEGFQFESLPATRETIARLADDVGLDGKRIVVESFHDSIISEFAWQRNAMERAGLGLDSVLLSFGDDHQVVDKEFNTNNYVQLIDTLAPGLQKPTSTDVPEPAIRLVHAV